MENTVFSHTALTDLAIVTLTGADATSFLQAQITQDIESLGADQAVLAGYCTARGRLLASMITLQKSSTSSDGWLLLTKADGAMSFVQRLRMFILRAKVEITVSEALVKGVRMDISTVSESSPGSIIAATPVSAHDAENLQSLPGDAAPYTVVRKDERIWIKAPDRAGATTARWWQVGPTDRDVPSSEVALQAWQADDIAAGLPWIQAATQETFIPQTVNMDLADGISFTKGCYPGQEVVARSHYRGTIKRRMAYATGSAMNLDSVDSLVGADTFDANKPDNPCGRIVNAAVADDKLHVLMEVQLADLNKADFRVGSGDGQGLSVSALPYSILPDTAG